MTEEEERSLLGGGDSPLHSHEFDRTVTHAQVLQYQDNESIREVATSSIVTYADDYLFVDSTIAPVTLSLPVARGGKTYTVVRVAGANNVTLTPLGTDTINGGASLILSSSYSPRKIKALKGTGWVQV